MLGAVVGDIIGSPYEYEHNKDYDFELISNHSIITDDTIMTLAVAWWLTDSNTLSSEDLIKRIQLLGRKYPSDYGVRFLNWLWSEHPQPNNSCGNGAAMRVSPIGLYAHTLTEALELAYITASVSHNHPEGIKGAQAVAAAIYMARNEYSKGQIREIIAAMFGYNLFRTIEEIRPVYHGGCTCQNSVPEAIIAFLDGKDFEDVVRLAVSLGGDADTQAAIAGSIAACVYPIPEDVALECEKRLKPDLLKIMNDFERYISEHNSVNLNLIC